jgi:hypothetical protein
MVCFSCLVREGFLNFCVLMLYAPYENINFFYITLQFWVKMPKKRRGSGHSRSTDGAKQKQKQREDEAGRASNASQSRLAHQLRSENPEFREEERQRLAATRQNDEMRSQERERDRVATGAHREDREYRDQERHQNRVAMAARRQVSVNRREEQEQLQRQRQSRKQESDDAKRLPAFRALRAQDEDQDQDNDQGSPHELLKQIHTEHWQKLAQDDFGSNLFLGNPMTEAGKELHKQLNKLEWATCSNCQESHIGMQLDGGGLCELCVRKDRREMYGPLNDITLTLAPECLRQLTPIEKSAFSLICPSVSIYKKGQGMASKGHCLSVFQDVQSIATTLPSLPIHLHVIFLKSPNEANVDQTFHANRANIMEALRYLRANNIHYKDIEISEQNASYYPVNGIMDNLPTLDPQELGISPEQPSAVNEDSARVEASTVDLPLVGNTILDSIQLALQSSQAREEDQTMDHLAWPTRAQQPASEFITGFFSKAFPDLFPDGKGDLRMPRRKNPSLKAYFKHLMAVNRDFPKHHLFAFVAANMV